MSSAKAGPGNTCPDCGGKPEKMTTNQANGDIVYACAVGHEWISGEGAPPPPPVTAPVETAMAEDAPRNRKTSKD